MSFSKKKTDAEKRADIIGDINVDLHNIDRAKSRIAEVDAKYEKALLDLKSEKGTAEAELNKAVEAYAKLRDKLDKLLPGVVVDVQEKKHILCADVLPGTGPPADSEG